MNMLISVVHTREGTGTVVVDNATQINDSSEYNVKKTLASTERFVLKRMPSVDRQALTNFEMRNRDEYHFAPDPKAFRSRFIWGSKIRGALNKKTASGEDYWTALRQLVPSEVGDFLYLIKKAGRWTFGAETTLWMA